MTILSRRELILGAACMFLARTAKASGLIRVARDGTLEEALCASGIVHLEPSKHGPYIKRVDGRQVPIHGPIGFVVKVNGELIKDRGFAQVPVRRGDEMKISLIVVWPT